MKTFKSIRKLRSPLARDLARLSRTLRVVQGRIDILTDKVETQAFELRAAHAEINGMHGKMMPQQEALDAGQELALGLDALTDDDVPQEEADPE